MNLYLISQNKNNDYDTYDSAVVAAPNEQAARETHPSGEVWPDEDRYSGNYWVRTPNEVTATLIGKAVKGTKAGVICASFNAG
jgi:hypothetical protein